MSGKRHSEQDMAHIRRTRHAAKEIVKSMQALGDDGMVVAHAKAVQLDPEAHPGAMACLMLSPEQQQALRDAAGLPDAEADHVTLIYLADAAAQIEAHKNELLAGLAQLAQATAPLQGEIGGVARFAASESSGGQDVCVALYDCATLPELYETITDCLEACGIELAADHVFTPHITLAYLAPDAPMPVESLERTPLAFDTLSLVWAGERIDLPLRGDDQAQYAGETMEDDLSEAPPSPVAVDAARTQFAAALGVDTVAEKAATDDLAFAPVAAIKMLNDGKLKIRSVVYGGKDLIGDAFDRDTDLGFARSPIGMPVFYDHAQRGIKSQVGQVTDFEQDDEGFSFIVELDRAKRYAEDIRRLQHEKALGGSTGAVSHLVVRQDGKLKRWIIGELSLTPTPMEPRTHPMAKQYISGAKSAPQAVGDTAAGDGATHIQSINTGVLTMDEEQLKALLGDQFKAYLGAVDERLAAVETRINTSINDRLKAFEDSPALKSAGFVTMDGGTKDKEIKNFVDFLKAVQRRDDRRLGTIYGSRWTEYGGDEVKALGEGSGPAGGYAVPIVYQTEIDKIAAMLAFFEALAYQVAMSSEVVKRPMLNQTDNPTSSGVGASGFYGGMYFTLDAENTTLTNRQPSFKLYTLQARKLTGLTTSSNELREDAPGVEKELMMIFAEGLAAAKQYLFLHHNGVGGPLGALSAANPSRLLHTRKSSGNDIEISDVTGLMSKMVPSLHGNAIFVCHPYAIDNLMQLSLVTNGDPAFSPASNAQPGSPLMGSLVGKPVYADEFMAVPGTAGDLAFVAPNAYAIGTRTGILIAGSEHAYFTSDQYAWRITTRIDGQPRIDSTIKLADGSNSEVSPSVVLS